MWLVFKQFLAGNLTSVALVAALVAGGGYHWWYKTDMEAELAAEKSVVAIMTNEYSKAVRTAEHNAEQLGDYIVKQYEITEAMRKKHQADIARLKQTGDIIERTRNVKPEDDGNVSTIITNTLTELRVLQQN